MMMIIIYCMNNVPITITQHKMTNATAVSQKLEIAYTGTRS